jgi:putative transposase
MNERVKFIARHLQKEEPFSELCEHAGVSRKTGYKWGARYDAGGVAALVDQSRAPRSHPHAVSSAVIERIVAHAAAIRGGASRDFARVTRFRRI